jgi:leucyl aminopeptidase
VQAQATTQSPFDTDADTIAIGVFEDEGVAHDLPGDALMALLDSGEAQRKFKRLAVTRSQDRRIILVGLGDRTKFDGERARVASGVVQARAAELNTKTLCWEVPHHVGDEVVAGLVQGTALHAYRFDRYKKDEDPDPFERLILSAHHDVSEVVRTADIIVRAQNRARDLGNIPANDLPPAALAGYAAELASKHGIEATILEEDAIRERGMGAFAAVAQGSAQSARLIRLDYEGPGASETPRLGLIGKAVTFDSGGLSLKPATSMFDMKFDMCGGAAVIEAVAALAELQAPVRVIGIVGATENLPGPTAVKPGDIVRALDGTTIEINNTDAEGRLVLADCITYALREGCERLVDIATLTGAVVTALGRTYAGLMSNDDDWARTVQDSGSETGELLWRLPLHDEYAQMVKGRYADLTNLTQRREASSITAAELLHHFAGDVPWAHLDIAGTAWDVRRPYLSRDATGFGVRLMVEIARRLAEDSSTSN